MVTGFAAAELSAAVQCDLAVVGIFHSDKKDTLHQPYRQADPFLFLFRKLPDRLQSVVQKVFQNNTQMGPSTKSVVGTSNWQVIRMPSADAAVCL